MRLKKYEVKSREEIDAIIRGSQVCRLAMAKDDAPYIVPLCFGYDGKNIYMHTAPEGLKIDHFLANPRVCFEFERKIRLLPTEGKGCDSTFEYETVIGFGTIQEILPVEDKMAALKWVVMQYQPDAEPLDLEDMKGFRVWQIIIDSMTGKRSPLKNSSSV